MSARTFAIASVIAATVGGIAPSSLAAISWTQPGGTSPGGVFAYSNGGADLGLFGDPVISDGGFTFFPSNYRASSQNGIPDTKTDRLFVTVSLPPSASSSSSMVGIGLSEIGDYSILGSGTVKVSGLLTATILGTWRNDPANVVGLVFSDTMDADGPTLFPGDATPVNDFGTNPPMPVSVVNGSVDGQWTAMMLVPIPANFQAKSIEIVMNNVLQATTSAGGTSFVEKKVVGLGTDPGMQLRIVVVPEPTTLSALGIAAPLLLRRRCR